MTDQGFVIGVDLGGTNVRAAAYSAAGVAVKDTRFENSSQAQSGAHRTAEAIAVTIEQSIRALGSMPTAIGIAIPGHVDDEAGIVRWAPNFGIERNGLFEYWRNVPLRNMLLKLFPMPIRFGNDANLAALGEYLYGSGKGVANCLVMITVGTGIGGGVVLGQPSVFGRATGPLVLLGGNQGGAELGHMIIQNGGLDCNAGSYGALEAYCQRDSIVRRAQHRLRRGRTSSLADRLVGSYELLTPQMLTEEADRGDALSREIWSEVGTMLGVGLANCINVFAPDVLAVGGQIAKAGEWLMGPARIAAENAAIPSLFADCRIVVAEELEDAGIRGAVALAAGVIG